MMAWYARAIARFPGGLVSQAQAAAMLGVNRTTVSRLLARGHLTAVHFPRPPDIAGLVVGADDPGWRQVAGWLGMEPEEPRAARIPKACYVSFADVVKLWRQGRRRTRCSRDWEEILGIAGPGPAPAPAEAAEQPASQERVTTEEMDSWML